MAQGREGYSLVVADSCGVVIGGLVIVADLSQADLWIPIQIQ